MVAKDLYRDNKCNHGVLLRRRFLCASSVFCQFIDDPFFINKPFFRISYWEGFLRFEGLAGDHRFADDIHCLLLEVLPLVTFEGLDEHSGALAEIVSDYYL